MSSYQVIARKYRPQRFSDVVGQEHVTRTLSQAIEQKRIAHAYLFCGPRGTGKTTVARIFAKCLNATDGPKVEFGADDQKALEIAEGRSLDVLEIDGASNNGVEQVRELRDTCRYAPASSRFKIYIIDEVHMLSTAAFNALLKTLEEPPAHVKFLFATTDPEKVLPTILSRCQRFDLRRIPTNLIVKHLAHIGSLEGVKIDPLALHAIARGAEGAMRDAESTLDQLISFCGNQIEESDVLSMFGLTAQSQLLELCQALLEGNLEVALRQLNQLAQNGKDLGRLLSDLLNHFRNLLIFQVSKGDLTMLEVTEAEAQALAAQAKLAPPESVGRMLEVLAEAEGKLRDAVSRKIVVEVALLKTVEARQALSLDAVLRQLNDLRTTSGGAAPAGSASAAKPSPTPHAAPTPAPAPAPAPAPRRAAPAEAPAAPAIATPEPPPAATAPAAIGDSLDELWDRLMEDVGKASQFAKSYLQKAHPVSFKNSLLTIGFDQQFEDSLSLADSPRTHTLIRTKMAEYGYPDVEVRFVKAAAPAHRLAALTAEESFETATATATPATPKPAAPAPSAKAAATRAPRADKSAPALAPAAAPKSQSVPFNKDEFKNDPLIQKALETFKGQILEVRAGTGPS